MLNKFIVSLTLVVVAVAFLLIGLKTDGAAEGGGNIVFSDTKSFPHVVFSHDKHLGAGLKCEDCHPKIFKKKAGSTDRKKLKMRTLKRGKYCGTCHNGSRAFSVRGSCKKCHVEG